MISDFFLALLLALIQGLTEFLPVSSSAHLLFPSLLFGAKDFVMSVKWGYDRGAFTTDHP